MCRRAGGSFLVSVHVWEWVTCGGRRRSSGRVTCDTFGPDSSSSSPACRCKSCKMHPTVPANFPHHRTCVDIMCHTFAKTPSSSSEFLQKGYEGVTPPMLESEYIASERMVHSMKARMKPCGRAQKKAAIIMVHSSLRVSRASPSNLNMTTSLCLPVRSP